MIRHLEAPLWGANRGANEEKTLTTDSTNSTNGKERNNLKKNENTCRLKWAVSKRGQAVRVNGGEWLGDGWFV